MEAVKTETQAPKRQRKAKEGPGLREVANTPKAVKAWGKEYKVGRFVLRDVAEALPYIGPLSYLYMMLEAYPRDAKGRPIVPSGDVMQILTRMIGMSGQSIIGLLSVITKEPEEFVEEQDPLDGLELLVEGVEKNLDFFSEKNVKRAKGLFSRLEVLLPARGTTPSENLSSEGTAPATTS